MHRHCHGLECGNVIEMIRMNFDFPNFCTMKLMKLTFFPLSLSELSLPAGPDAFDGGRFAIPHGRCTLQRPDTQLVVFSWSSKNYLIYGCHFQPACCVFSSCCWFWTTCLKLFELFKEVSASSWGVPQSSISGIFHEISQPAIGVSPFMETQPLPEALAAMASHFFMGELSWRHWRIWKKHFFLHVRKQTYVYIYICTYICIIYMYIYIYTYT